MSEDIKNIAELLKSQGEMAFINAATIEQIESFERENDIVLPSQYKEWLLFSDGGECFLPAGIQLYGVANMPIIDVNDDDRPNKNYCVIGALSNGDSILFEIGKENISIFNHSDMKIEDDEIYPNFRSFLNDLSSILGIGG